MFNYKLTNNVFCIFSFVLKFAYLRYFIILYSIYSTVKIPVFKLKRPTVFTIYIVYLYTDWTQNRCTLNAPICGPIVDSTYELINLHFYIRDICYPITMAVVIIRQNDRFANEQSTPMLTSFKLKQRSFRHTFLVILLFHLILVANQLQQYLLCLIQ